MATSIAIGVLSVVGICTAGTVARQLRKPDPGMAVIDEVVGQLISMLPLWSFEWRSWLASFLLFRIFDIWKPFPSRQVEAWPGGWGIMADDWVAGIYAAASIIVARLFFA